MKAISLAEALATKELRDFMVVARQYCLLVEDEQPVISEAFLRQIRWTLLNLYSTALNLDRIDLQSTIDPEVPKIDLQQVLLVVARKIADSRYYWSVFDPTDMDDTAAGCDDLLDDLGDIYKDLKFALMEFDLNTEDGQENAVYEFKSDFENHWGRHCINALRALHFFIQKAE